MRADIELWNHVILVICQMLLRCCRCCAKEGLGCGDGEVVPPCLATGGSATQMTLILQHCPIGNDHRLKGGNTGKWGKLKQLMVSGFCQLYG